MSQSETSREFIRAKCAEICTTGGIPAVQKALSDGDFKGSGREKFVHEWIADQALIAAQEKRMNTTANAAFWSAVGSVVSAVVALIALLIKG